MLPSRPLPSAPIDQWFTAVAGSGSALFPVARTMAGGSRDGHLHLVDGDGASFCEVFTQEELERLPLVWVEVVEGNRCAACAALVWSTGSR